MCVLVIFLSSLEIRGKKRDKGEDGPPASLPGLSSPAFILAYSLSLSLSLLVCFLLKIL